MRCPYCGNSINENSCFCRFCGEPLEPESEPRGEILEEKEDLGKSIRWLAAAFAILLILAAAAVFVWNELQDKEREELLSGAVKVVELEDSYVLEKDTIDLADPEVSYDDGTKENITKYTAYINDTKCEMKDGRVCVPDGTPNDCTLRLEWEKDGQKQSCEKAITVASAGEVSDEPDPTSAVPVQPENSSEDRIEATKTQLLETYGRAQLAQEDKENADGWVIWSKGDVLSEGIIDFYEMDMDQDGMNELLCTRVLEEDESQDVSDFFGILDCQVYRANGETMECIYSTYEEGYGVRAGFGGLIVKDGSIPHFADTNHAVPINVFTMENGQINAQSIDAPAGTEEMSMAELRGVLREVYEGLIGGSENYTVLEEIEGSDQYFSTEVEPLP